MAEKVQLTGIVKQKVVEKDTTAGSEYNTYIPEDRQLVVVKDGDTYTIVIGDGTNAVKDCAGVGGSGGSEYKELVFSVDTEDEDADGYLEETTVFQEMQGEETVAYGLVLQYQDKYVVFGDGDENSKISINTLIADGFKKMDIFLQNSSCFNIPVEEIYNVCSGSNFASYLYNIPVYVSFINNHDEMIFEELNPNISNNNWTEVDEVGGGI